ncbi:MAG: ABC transporter permease [Bacteroidota bacterium]
MPDKPKLDFSLRLIKRFCKEELVEEIQGNLMEYRQLLAQNNLVSRLKYWYQVLYYFHPSFLQIFKLKNKGPMFIFNPKVAVRNLIRHRSTTIISLLGFVVGLTSVIFLYFYIENELNVDAFHAEKDKIYRVIRLSENNNTGDIRPVSPTSGPYAEALVNDFPETVQSTNRVLFERGLITYGEKSFYEEDIIFADPNFFSFFSYPLKAGNPERVLSGANDMVISQRIAKKYFGEEDPIGKTLDIDAGAYKYTVTGVFDDIPNKTHLQFDMVCSMALFDSFEWFSVWYNHGLNTYLKVNTPEEAEYLESQFPSFMDKYMGEHFERFDAKWGLELEPLNELYFNNIAFEFPEVKHGNRTNIVTLGSIAVAILFIACFNYINLSIAQSYKRAKEVSVRKVLGVEKKRLIAQFLGESIFILLVSIVVAVFLSELLRNSFNRFFDLNVVFDWLNPLVISFFIILLIVIVLSSGLYPALLLSSFNPLNVFKTGKPTLGKNVFVRKGLVILQFAMSIFLMVATMLIFLQLNYIKNRDLGFDDEAVLIVESNNSPIDENFETFKNQLRTSTYVKSVTSASGEPGGYHDNAGFDIQGVDEPVQMYTVFTDTEYMETFNILIIAGRSFNREITSDRTSSIMINESALTATGLTAEEVIGRKIEGSFWDLDHRIIGVFQDYNFKGLKSEIEPMAIITNQDVRVFAIKIDAHNMGKSIEEVERIFKGIAPDYPMTSRFLDESISLQYEEEDKQARIFSGFALLSIVLACMGIFGLATFSAHQRQKELSIRKVLGASVRQVILLISKEFLILVAISSTIAVPFVFYFMSGWLDSFAYRIELFDNWSLFVLGGIFTAIIAFATIGAKTYKTAASNPSDIIRDE